MSRTTGKLVIGVVLLLVMASVLVTDAQGHYSRCAETRDSRAIACRRHHVYHASLTAFCGDAYRTCYQGVKAFAVAGCETGYTYDYWAENGQYKGIWQMGTSERKQCGQTWGKDPWTQARAARCWLRLTSWESWECA